jgi:hypothetical protein
MILVGLAGGGLISLAIAATGGVSLRGDVRDNQDRRGERPHGLSVTRVPLSTA